MKTNISTIYEIRGAEGLSRFLDILKLLVDFDERSFRANLAGVMMSHCMRKAVAHAHPGEVRVFLKPLQGFLYHVVAEINHDTGSLSTGWHHEDGIPEERTWHGDYRDHPVHGIDCVTDILKDHGVDVDLPDAELCVRQSTLELLSMDQNEY